MIKTILYCSDGYPYPGGDKMITQNQINQVVETIVKNIQPEKVILFGSYANGNPNEDSDLDLLIIKDMPEKRSRRGREIRKHLRGSKIPIDLLVYTPQEIELRSMAVLPFTGTKGQVLGPKAKSKNANFLINPLHLQEYFGSWRNIHIIYKSKKDLQRQCRQLKNFYSISPKNITN
jgi:predicted nucleotidyltransferase